MDRREQQPQVPFAGNSDSMPLEWTRTETGGWRTEWALSLPPQPPLHSGPATAEEFLGSMGLGQEVEQGATTQASDFGPEGRPQPPVAPPSTPDVGQPHVSSHPEQAIHTSAVTPPAAEDAEITQRVEDTGTLGADSALAREEPPLIALEEDDFSDVSVLRRPTKRDPNPVTKSPSDRSREAGQENIPGSVARRQSDIRPRWQRPIEED